MARGRQYYDPEIQTTRPVEGEANLTRIELFQDQDGKWIGRRIGPLGAITDIAPGDFDHDAALRQAEMFWPGLTVYELRDEREDSTWEGVGPSPRIWGAPPSETPPNLTPAVEVEPEQVQVRGITADPGTYLHVDDIVRLLRSYADTYDADGNPSAGLALRTAAEMLGV